MRKGEVETLPSVIVLDPQGNVVSKEGYANMAFFPGKWMGWPILWNAMTDVGIGLGLVLLNLFFQ